MYFTNCAKCGYVWEGEEKPERCLGCGSKDISSVKEEGES